MRYLLTGEETKRLRFRLLEKNDFDTWLPLFSTPEAVNFLGLANIPSPEERCQKWFEITYNRYESNLGGMNVLLEKGSDKFIGQCGLLVQEVDGIRELEIGYSILPQYWGNGYATEAARKCKEFAFDKNFAKSLISIVHVDNIRSERVARKNGMILNKQTVFKEMKVNIFRISR